MKNIGIFGGTFNPIHIGHLIAAQEVMDRMKLEKIIFLPTGNPPHKNENDVISAIHRFNMVKLAIEDNEKFGYSDIEVKREGKTYTYDTLCQLHNIYYDTRFYFIIGFDTLRDIDTWKRVEEVFNIASFIVVNRGNYIFEMNSELEDKRIKYNANISVVNIPDIGISSTDIRKRVCLNDSIKYLVPDKVAEYIERNDLYRGESNV
jgi:nicotinate-nucleotide adenylyltransferase